MSKDILDTPEKQKVCFSASSYDNINKAESLTMVLFLFLHSYLFTSCVSCVSSGGAAAGPRLNNNQLYKFSYTTEVLVDRTKGSKEGSAGYRISSDVHVNLVWRDPSSKDDQLIKLVVC